MTLSRPPSPAASRQKRSRARGRHLAVTLRDPAAIVALASIAEAHGGIRAGIERALLAWLATRPEEPAAPTTDADVTRRPRGRDRAGY